MSKRFQFRRFDTPHVFISASLDMDAAARVVMDVVRSVADELNDEIEPYYYAESDRERAWSTHRTWQLDIPRPADSNAIVTVSLFGERIGNLLPDTFMLPADLEPPEFICF